ncbi:P-loop containing nucleoside triphosphate hydrolase protein, partial [Aaosphaeria arxii CBS 175.79]
MAALTADEQAGHTAHVAGLIYAREMMEQAGVVASRRSQFRMSSIDWHRLLGVGSVQEDKDAYKKRKRAPYEDEADEARVDRWMRMRKMDTATPLQRMMGETAQFRGLQKEAIEAMVAGESPVVAVMPTGAGKSMLFMLPAWAEQGGTTVVVVPLIALRGDIHRRCQKVGISCAEWENRRPPDAAAVVLVTPESAVKVECTTFLNRMRATRRLDRIVIDECHIVLNRRYTFRKEMQPLGKLVGAETQMVLLTATLPPREEDHLFRRMHFDRDEVKIFRAATTRITISYRAIPIGKEVRKRAVEGIPSRMIQQKSTRYRTGKIVIYGNSVAKVKRLAQEVGCDAYHHDAAGKASMVEAFMAGKQRMIVATSALGMGVDIADIRCIIHVDWPFSMMDYAQESGRAGRDGLPSEAVVIAHAGDPWRAEDQQTQAEQAMVRSYVEGPNGLAQCRRVVLDGYLDRRGSERVRCEEGEEKCDVCRGNVDHVEENEDVSDASEADDQEADDQEADDQEAEKEQQRQVFRQQERERQAARQRLIEERQQAFGEMEWLRRQLALWSNRCGICAAAGEGREGQEGHDVRQCWRAESRQA